MGITPSITNALSEYDAAMMVGCSEKEYRKCMEGRTAVSRGYDFYYRGDRCRVKANRPSGKPGSLAAKVGQATNYDWNYLIWILYDPKYNMIEAWQWGVRNT